VAVIAGFPKVVEQLVGYGADLNTANADGETVLHMLLAEGPELNMRPVSGDMTQLKKVQKKLTLLVDNMYCSILVLCRFMMNFSTLTLESLLKAMLQ